MIVYKQQIDELKGEISRLLAEIGEVQGAISLLQSKCNHTNQNGQKALVSADPYGKKQRCTICGLITDDE